jgi:outer membrane receptor protein involved in Fe transport
MTPEQKEPTAYGNAHDLPRFDRACRWLRGASPYRCALELRRRRRKPLQPTLCRFLLDGEEIRAADFTMIDSASIATIEHLRGPTAISLYGARAEAGVIQIATKAAPRPTTPTTLLFLLDGREIPAALTRVLDTRKINSVEVLKGGAAFAYGKRASDGVVVIRSKAG